MFSVLVSVDPRHQSVFPCSPFETPFLVSVLRSWDESRISPLSLLGEVENLQKADLNIFQLALVTHLPIAYASQSCLLGELLVHLAQLL